MPTNPKVKQVAYHASSVAEDNAALNQQVDNAFDEGLGAYQASQVNTLEQIDALYERANNRVKEVASKELERADEAAYSVIVDAYRKNGLKGGEDA